MPMFTDDRCGVHTITVARECTWFRERVDASVRGERAPARAVRSDVAMTRVPTGDRCRMYMCGVSGFIIICANIFNFGDAHPAIRLTDTRHAQNEHATTHSHTLDTASATHTRLALAHDTRHHATYLVQETHTLTHSVAPRRQRASLPAGACVITRPSP